jgi:hypothetical protein
MKMETHSCPSAPQTSFCRGLPSRMDAFSAPEETNFGSLPDPMDKQQCVHFYFLPDDVFQWLQIDLCF